MRHYRSYATISSRRNVHMRSQSRVQLIGYSDAKAMAVPRDPVDGRAMPEQLSKFSYDSVYKTDTRAAGKLRSSSES